MPLRRLSLCKESDCCVFGGIIPLTSPIAPKNHCKIEIKLRAFCCEYTIVPPQTKSSDPVYSGRCLGFWFGWWRRTDDRQPRSRTPIARTHDRNRRTCVFALRRSVDLASPWRTSTNRANPGASRRDRHAQQSRVSEYVGESQKNSA